MEFNSIEALEVEEKRLWAIVQERAKAKEAAQLEWFNVRKQVTELRERERIDGLVESRLKEKENQNGKQKKSDRPRSGVLSRVFTGRR